MQGLGLVMHAGPDRSPRHPGGDVGERLPETYGELGRGLASALDGQQSGNLRRRPAVTAWPGRTPRASNSSGNYVGCQVQVAKGDANEGSIKLLNDTP
jgi:hypothetical protein